MNGKKGYRLAILALAALVAAAAVTAAVLVPGWKERRQAVEAAQERLYMEWDKYLAYSNELDEIHLWTLEYVNAYVEERSWDALLKARAAVAASREALKNVQVPNAAISREIQDVLHHQKDEVYALMMNMEQAAWDLDSIDWFLENVSCYLEEFFPYDSYHLNLRKIVEYQEQDWQFMRKITGAFTNQCFLTWNMQDRWQGMQETYPAFASFCGPWDGNSKRLEERSSQLTNEYSALQDEFKATVLSSQIALNELEKNMGDLSRLAERMSLPTGVPLLENGDPALFPLPNWLQEPAVYYILPTDTEEIRLVQMGMDIADTPETACYYYDYVTYEEYADYYQALRQLGLEGFLKDGAESSAMFVTNGAYTLVVQWSPTETVLYVSKPMACLVAPVDFDALTMYTFDSRAQ